MSFIFNKKKFNQGFTLIELLVVIAVVGTMAAIVLTQLNSARGKGADAQKRANFKNLATQAALFYESPDPPNPSPGTYTGVCTYSPFQKIYDASGAICTPSVANFRVRVQLTQQNVFNPTSGVDWLCADAEKVVVCNNDPTGGSGAACPAAC